MNKNLINEKIIYIAVKGNAYVLKSNVIINLLGRLNYNFIYSLIELNETCEKIILDFFKEDDYFWLYLIRKNINYKKLLPENLKKDEMFLKLM